MFGVVVSEPRLNNPPYLYPTLRRSMTISAYVALTPAEYISGENYKRIDEIQYGRGVIPYWVRHWPSWRDLPHLTRSRQILRPPKKIDRTSIEHLSKIDRTSIEHLSKIDRTSIEYLSNVYRTCICLLYTSPSPRD